MTTNSGITSRVIHAPSRNLLTPMISRAEPVANAPAPLMNALARQCGPFTSIQCRTMPVCDSVNAVKAPTANNGTRACDLPPKIMIKAAVAVASTRMPLLNTSRSPKPLSWRAGAHRRRGWRSHEGNP